MFIWSEKRDHFETVIPSFFFFYSHLCMKIAIYEKSSVRLEYEEKKGGGVGGKRRRRLNRKG